MARATFGIPGMRISGKLWGAVLAGQPDGTTVLRALPERLPPRTPAQRASAARFRPVAQAWRALSLVEVQAWRDHARRTREQPYRAFTALAAKCLQMRPGGLLPSLPPATPFQGDGIVVAVSVSLPWGRGNGGVDRSSSDPKQAEGATTPSLPSPRGEDSGSVVFSSTAPNAPGVVTELLLQRLANRNRMPTPKGYRTQTFVAFAPGTLKATVPVEPGVYACAVRFVREATGQEAAAVEIGTVEVG